jgi:hypothetical protein
LPRPSTSIPCLALLNPFASDTICPSATPFSSLSPVWRADLAPSRSSGGSAGEPSLRPTFAARLGDYRVSSLLHGELTQVIRAQRSAAAVVTSSLACLAHRPAAEGSGLSRLLRSRAISQPRAARAPARVSPLASFWPAPLSVRPRRPSLPRPPRPSLSSSSPTRSMSRDRLAAMRVRASIRARLALSWEGPVASPPERARPRPRPFAMSRPKSRPKRLTILPYHAPFSPFPVRDPDHVDRLTSLLGNTPRRPTLFRRFDADAC